jgi:hypothetical protein
MHYRRKRTWSQEGFWHTCTAERAAFPYLATPKFLINRQLTPRPDEKAPARGVAQPRSERRLRPQPFSILLAQRFIAFISKPLNNIAVHRCQDLALLFSVALRRQLWRTPIVNSLSRNAALTYRWPNPGNDGTQGLTFEFGHSLLDRPRACGNQYARGAGGRAVQAAS